MTFRASTALALLAALLATASTSALAAKASGAYTSTEFAPAFNQAVGEIWKRSGSHKGQTAGGGNPVSGEEIKGTAPGGTFRATLGAACPFPDSSNPASYNYNKVMSFGPVPAIISNNGDSFTYQFQTQEVSDLYYPLVEKEMAKRRKELMKEFKDVTVTFDRSGGKAYTLTATFPYVGGVKANEITERLVYFMSKSTFAMCDIVTFSWLANEDLWDQLKGDISGPVSREQFIVINPLLRKDNYETTGTKATGGIWKMKGDGWGETYENYTDRMELSMGMPIAKDIAPDKVQAIYAELQALAPAKGAQKLDIYWTDGYVWLTSVYSYTGMTGKQVMKTVQSFSDEYAEDHFKAAKKVFKRYL
jgi:hypothetical protein